MLPDAERRGRIQEQPDRVGGTAGHQHRGHIIQPFMIQMLNSLVALLESRLRVTRNGRMLAAWLVVLSLGLPRVASAFQPDEARRQAQMERSRQSAADIDRRNSDQAFQAGLARAADARAASNAGSRSSSSGSRAGSGSPSSGSGSGGNGSTGPQSVVATRTYRIFVGETMPQAAARLGREAAAGSAESQYLLGRMNYAGYGVPTNEVEARRLFMAAAVQQHVEASAFAGTMLVNGVGGPVDRTRGMAYLLAAANAGNVDGLALWGTKTILATDATSDRAQVDRALSMLERAADAGKALAQAVLGTHVYFYGVSGAAQDSVKAVKFLRMGAAQGDPMCMSLLGELMVGGHPWTGLNRTEGWSLVSRAAQAGNGHAMAKLGTARFNGDLGQQKDVQGGVRLIRQSAESGDRDGMFVFANMLYLGNEVPENKPEAIRYARLAAEADLGDAQLMMAKMSYFGDVGLAKNRAEAVRWSRLSSESGSPGGQMFYARLLWTADGVPQDRIAAARLIQKAAAQGDQDAMTELRDPDVQAILRTLPAPAATARPAATAGPAAAAPTVRGAKPAAPADSNEIACNRGVANACVTLGINYTDGVGVTIDLPRGATLFQKACSLNDPRGCMLWGYALNSGRGVAVNVSQALSANERACTGADGFGCNNLGLMYQSGSGVTRDERRAFELYSKACTLRTGIGCRNAGILHADAVTLPHDRSLAVTEFDKGCELGDLDSCNKQAWHVEQGLGTQRNVEKARRLYAKACDGGYQLACTNGRNLASAAGAGQGAVPQPTLATDGFTVCTAYMAEGRKFFYSVPFAAASSRSNEFALAYASMLREKGYAAASPYAPAGSSPPALTVDCRSHPTPAQANEFMKRVVAGSTRERMTTVPTSFNPL